MEDVVYDWKLDNTLSKVISGQFDAPRVDNLHTTKLLDLEFKVGQPYLMRHSTKSKPISALIDTEEKLKIGCCDHFFALSDLRMASYPLDLPLLEQSKEYSPSLPIFVALSKHR